MKLWLDDVREPWKWGHIGWDWVKSYDEAIDYIDRFGPHIEEASFDHDLCFEDQLQNKVGEFKERTGYDVVKYLVEKGYRPFSRCHSANPWGQTRINALLDEYGMRDEY